MITLRRWKISIEDEVEESNFYWEADAGFYY